MSNRFVIPNIRKDGSRFVNILYISKIKTDGIISYYLASQFNFSKFGRSGIDVYEKALESDLDNLNSLANETGWIFLGSSDALSSSSALIAQAKLD